MTKGRWITLASVGLLLLTIWFSRRHDQPREIEEGKPPPTFISATECIGADGKPAHGTWRWAVKVDGEKPPKAPAPDIFPPYRPITAVTALDVGSWPDLIGIKTSSPRQDNELEWFEVVGRVRLVRCEADGDLHIQLWSNTKSGNPQVVVEVPLGEPWNEIRKQVWDWSSDTFPCKPHRLNLTKYPVIRVTGKAFYDGIHAGSVPNRRSYDNDVTVWEIHPVMKLEEVAK